MAKAKIAVVSGLKVRVGCQDGLCVNLDADETLRLWESRYVREVLSHSCEKNLCRKSAMQLLHFNLYSNVDTSDNK